MSKPSAGRIALREIKQTVTSDFEPVYSVTFDLRVGEAEGTITIPVSALDGHDTETVSIARVTLLHVLATLVDAANELPEGHKPQLASRD